MAKIKSAWSRDALSAQIKGKRIVAIYEACDGVKEKMATPFPFRRSSGKKDNKNVDRSLNKIEKSLALLQFRSATVKPRINHLFEP